MLKLYHGSELIGLVQKTGPDNLSWMVGTIELTSAAENYKDLFAFFGAEEKLPHAKTHFPAGLLKDWNIEVEDGKQKQIDIPGIYEDGEIFWRWLRLGNSSN